MNIVKYIYREKTDREREREGERERERERQTDRQRQWGMVWRERIDR